jgi:hypothetical protein
VVFCRYTYKSFPSASHIAVNMTWVLHITCVPAQNLVDVDYPYTCGVIYNHDTATTLYVVLILA